MFEEYKVKKLKKEQRKRLDNFNKEYGIESFFETDYTHITLVIYKINNLEIVNKIMLGEYINKIIDCLIVPLGNRDIIIEYRGISFNVPFITFCDVDAFYLRKQLIYKDCIFQTSSLFNFNNNPLDVTFDNCEFKGDLFISGEKADMTIKNNFQIGGTLSTYTASLQLDCGINSKSDINILVNNTIGHGYKTPIKGKNIKFTAYNNCSYIWLCGQIVEFNNPVNSEVTIDSQSVTYNGNKMINESNSTIGIYPVEKEKVMKIE